MRRALLLVAGLVFCGVLLGAESVTVVLPNAASLVGVAPFFSDVRVFNTSYTDTVTVTATYRCFIGPCPSSAPQVPLALSPRQSLALDDICVTTFSAPNTGGGVEFSFVGEPEQVVVTSRLYSTSPTPTVGMFIPGLPLSEAYADTVLTSLRNGGSVAGFRTNAGLFNPNDTAVTVTFDVFDGSAAVGHPVGVSVGAHSGAQVNQIFRAAGVETLQTSNGVVAVHASAAIFSYAAVIDNNTQDPYLVVGAEDLPAQTFTPVATATPTPPSATATPTPTRTPTPPSGTTVIVNVAPGGGFSFAPSTISIHVGDTVRWNWGSGGHSTTSGSSCNPDGLWNSGILSSGSTFSRTFNTAGNFPYFCIPHCGLGMTGTVSVSP